MLKEYYRLTKPGIIRGNSIAAVAGFFHASRGNIDFWLLLVMLAGLGLVIASACVFNNFLDRGLDAKMQRTKDRALAAGRISNLNAILYATLLGVVGSSLLAVGANVISASIAVFGLLAYVVLYGVFKRRNKYGTLAGSISGAIPPVVGYTAVSGRVDAAALVLFLILVFWQMPHFYAIGIFRIKDYAAANLPILPIKEGIETTKKHMIFYVIGFIAAAASLAIFSYTGPFYLVMVLLLGAAWLKVSFDGLRRGDSEAWARRMFGFSLTVLLLWSLAVIVDSMTFRNDIIG